MSLPHQATMDAFCEFNIGQIKEIDMKDFSNAMLVLKS